MTRHPRPLDRAAASDLADNEVVHPATPPGEAPLLCEGCSAGCIGHGRYEDRCHGAGCECPKRWPRSLQALDARWTKLKNSARLDEDASILSTALRVAAEQFDRDAEASRAVSRTREQFLLQAAQCRVIAEAIEP